MRWTVIAGADAGERTVEELPTREYGPPPVRTARAVAAGVGRRGVRVLAALAVAAAVLAGTGALGRWAWHRGQAGGCPAPSVAGAALPSDQVLSVDIDGDGCREAVLANGGVLVVAPGVLGPQVVRFAAPMEGASALAGDWDCDRHATPAVYDATTGHVIYYAGWTPEAAAAPIETRAARPGGVPMVVHRRGGCDVVSVP
jgi:hypothetical protein